MVDDMDAALRLLAESPVPAALADIDAGVFARIANRRAHDLGRSVIVGAAAFALLAGIGAGLWPIAPSQSAQRSEEHTSELQSLMRISYAVFCLKKKNNNT